VGKKCKRNTKKVQRIHMETFTLEEAKRWIGHTVIAKTDFNAGRA
jgi:hypothetical protein